MSAGAIGSFVGNPTEVALIRMTSDGRLPVDQRRNYSSVFNAIARIYKEEGVAALWRVSHLLHTLVIYNYFRDVSRLLAERWLLMLLN